jgi:hypothetical protein
MGSEGPQRYRDPEEAAPGPADPIPDLPLLEKVLKETLSAPLPPGPLRDSEWQALLEVARRHRGQALVLEPVAIDLVQAMLRTRFDRLQLPDDSWQHMSREIATTLLDDPQTHSRLERFWSQLTESTA